MVLGLQGSDNSWSGLIANGGYLLERQQIYGETYGCSNAGNVGLGAVGVGITTNSRYSGIVCDYSSLKTFSPMFAIKY